MTDSAALLAAMAADPADDTIRLAYADFLEEGGDTDRAEFVRVQVELARMNVNDPARYPLVVRHVEFLSEFVPRWRAELPHLSGIEWGDFSRGLVEEVQAANEAAVVRHAKAIFAQPAVHVIRLARLGDGRRLANVASLTRVRAFRLVAWRNPAEDDVFRDSSLPPTSTRCSSSICMGTGPAMARPRTSPMAVSRSWKNSGSVPIESAMPARSHWRHLNISAHCGSWICASMRSTVPRLAQR